MQTVKDKLNEMKEMRKVKAEAKAEEKAEKELAKAKVDIAHEIRLAREAEGAMELHVAKAGEKAEREITKHAANQSPSSITQPQPDFGATTNEPYSQNPDHRADYSTTAATPAAMGTGSTTNTTELPPSNYM
ncbi:hypothetical protein U1Q18_035939 [Sarracenia purpurea var. burkii]